MTHDITIVINNQIIDKIKSGQNHYDIAYEILPVVTKRIAPPFDDMHNEILDEIRMKIDLIEAHIQNGTLRQGMIIA